MVEIIAAGPFFPVLPVFVDWPGGAVRLHSGLGTLEWDGEDWHGVGALGTVSAPADAGTLAQLGMELTLHGLPEGIWSHADDPVRNRRIEVWIGCTTTPGGNVLAAPPFLAQQQLGAGFRIEEGADAFSAVLRAVFGPNERSVLAAFHSYEDQMAATAGADTAGRHLIFAEAEAGQLTWPETRT
jgi:hypothetical protein